MSYRIYRKTDRFENYIEITARRHSVGACGHEIKPGDVIGWNPRSHKARCVACWRTWRTENVTERENERMAEAAGYVPDMYGPENW